MADDNSEGSGVGSEEIDDAEILEQLEQLNADDNAEVCVCVVYYYFIEFQY